MGEIKSELLTIIIIIIIMIIIIIIIMFGKKEMKMQSLEFNLWLSVFDMILLILGGIAAEIFSTFESP